MSYESKSFCVQNETTREIPNTIVYYIIMGLFEIQENLGFA